MLHDNRLSPRCAIEFSTIDTIRNRYSKSRLILLFRPASLIPKTSGASKLLSGPKAWPLAKGESFLVVVETQMSAQSQIEPLSFPPILAIMVIRA